MSRNRKNNHKKGNRKKNNNRQNSNNGFGNNQGSFNNNNGGGFGGGFGGGLFGGGDPFQNMEQMMTQHMSSFGNMSSGMDMMMSNEFHGHPSSNVLRNGGGKSVSLWSLFTAFDFLFIFSHTVSFANVTENKTKIIFLLFIFTGGNNGGGTYTCVSSSFSSSTGADGKTQRFQSSTVSSNVGGRRVSESKQAYSNSDGVDKAAWERMMDDRGRKVIKERHRGGTQEEVTRDLYHGMAPEDGDDFERDWTSVGGVHGGRLTDDGRGRGGGGGRASNALRLESGRSDSGSNRGTNRRTDSRANYRTNSRAGSEAYSRTSSRASTDSRAGGAGSARYSGRRPSRQEHFGDIEHLD